MNFIGLLEVRVPLAYLDLIEMQFSLPRNASVSWLPGPRQEQTTVPAALRHAVWACLGHGHWDRWHGASLRPPSPDLSRGNFAQKSASATEIVPSFYYCGCQ